MVSLKFCPNCGSEIDESDMEFCTECGCNLLNPAGQHTPAVGFFDNLVDKTSFPVIVFSFIIFGIFLFVGSFVWSLFISNGTIDLITYFILVIVFSVFLSAIFVGYFGCKDNSYLIPNFSMYLGSIFAVVLCGVGLIFTFVWGIIFYLGSLLPFGSGSSSYATSTQSSASSLTSLDLSSIFKIVLFILLVPVAAYLGVYLGFILRDI